MQQFTSNYFLIYYSCRNTHVKNIWVTVNKTFQNQNINRGYDLIHKNLCLSKNSFSFTLKLL